MIKITCVNSLVICFADDADVCLADGTAKTAANLATNDRLCYPPMGVQVVSTTESY